MPRRPSHTPQVASFLAVFVAFCAACELASAVAIEPTEVEQYMLELINRARANPGAEAARYSIDLNEGLPPGTISYDPKQPMAFNFYLNDSASTHSQWLLDNDVFQHEGPNGNRPSDRARAAGYTLNAPWGVGENLAWQGNTRNAPDPVLTTTQLHAGLFVDEGIADRGHRTNMLAPNFKEAGIGIIEGQFQQYHAVMIATEFAYTAGNAFLTGVVYEDLVADNFYTPVGEGYADVAIRALNTTTGGIYETFTFATGGYTLPVPPGTYRVTFEGESLLSTTFLNVAIGSQNVKLDVVNSEDLRPWSNPLNPFDADGNGSIEPRDVLLLIDSLNRDGVRDLSVAPSSVAATYFDVNRDALFSSADVLAVIDALSRESLGLNGGAGGGLLSFVESSDSGLLVMSVPEPSGAILAFAGLMALLTCARRRGKLSA